MTPRSAAQSRKKPASEPRARQALDRETVLRAGRTLEAKSRWQSAVDWYQRALAIDPLIEECYQRIMLCHRHLGHNSDMVAVYNRCCTMFDAMLGIEPSTETKKIFKKYAE